jgi:hypothetical protein
VSTDVQSIDEQVAGATGLWRLVALSFAPVAQSPVLVAERPETFAALRAADRLIRSDADAKVQFQLSTLGLAQTIRTDGATEWKYVFQPSPHWKNEIQHRSQPVSSVATKERIYHYVFVKGASSHIEIKWQKIKIVASPISYSDVFSMAW